MNQTACFDAPSTDPVTPMFDVAIVGWGPTGLVLSSLLGQAGHRVVVVERWPTLYPFPRLTHIDGETARIVQSAGDADWALRDARSFGEGRPLRMVGADDVPIQNVDLSGRQSGFAAHYSIHQPDIEDAIASRVYTFANVTLRRGWQITGLRQNTDHVTIDNELSDPGRAAGVVDDGVRSLHARYVVGCDGATSQVRDEIGVTRIDLGIDEVWLQLDTLKLRRLPARFDDAKYIFEAGTSRMFMPVGTQRERFTFRVTDWPTDAVIDDAAAWRLLATYHDLGRDDVEIERCLTYQQEAKIATQWRAGRVFLAGDAVHTMPPDLGQGACTGMRDAANLAWKLSRVLDGRSDESLLDTYELERRPPAEAMVRASWQQATAFNTADADQLEMVVGFLRSLPAMELPSPPPLASGVVRIEAGEPATPAGLPSPQGLVRSGDHIARFDAIAGPGWHLIMLGDATADIDDTTAALLDRLGVRAWTVGRLARGEVLGDVDNTYHEWLGERSLVGIITRPDFITYAGIADETSLPAVASALADALR